ncbi:SNRNP200 protein [Hibiscus syriacus]|uniref:SNRNP200 protein n=1 Tax=Hibiscus syriacus TaxID=106335 RepID=A0A6A2XUX3_HIBSY|nr:SNRNP200 protein [Hibiscus syriacus]
MAVAGKHQVLIFVHSRKETVKTARAVRDTALANDTLSRFLKEDAASREILQSHTDMVKSNDLKDLLPYGFAIHHAGLARTDRQIVEELFADGHVQVLVSTATLAWGVNLPAHTVIIKGTQIYSPEKGAWTELSPLDVMQMLGRAGRPQYDSYGEGIIITGHSELQYYLSLMNQQLPIESQFVSKLTDQLNAEIVLGTVQNAREACNWIGYTYLYIRMLRNPTLYGLPADVLSQDLTLEERRADLTHSAAVILDKNNLVKYDRKSGYFQNKQDAVDYLTWTFMYRRLTQNPNYYNLQGVSHRHLSDHLSELVENTLNDLEASKCITIEDDMDLSPLNLGMIASYYYISYTTIERFSSSLISKTKMKGLLEILASASEYANLPIRPGEEEVLRRLINHQRFSFENPRFTDPHVKANALLQAHFSRQHVGGNLSLDQREVVLYATRLLQAMVDVISSNGWLSLALLAMEVSQMVTQGMWERDSMLLQLPHFTKELAKRCQENPGKNIETIFDLVEMEDDERRELLQMSDLQLLDIAKFCNRFPNIDLSYEVIDSENVRAREYVTLQVALERDLEGKTEVGPVDAPRYPKAKDEGWWLVVGDTKSNQLLAIKRVSLQRRAKVKLEFAAPTEAAEKTYTLYFMCDSYLGCDQEYSFNVDVKEAAGPDEDSG